MIIQTSQGDDNKTETDVDITKSTTIVLRPTNEQIECKKRARRKKNTWSFVVDGKELTSVLTRAQIRISDSSLIIKKRSRKQAANKQQELELDFKSKPVRRTREEYTGSHHDTNEENVSVYDIAPFFKRGAAFLIDSGIIGLVIFLLEKDQFKILSEGMNTILVRAVIYFCTYMVVLLIPSIRHGSSVGKSLVGIRVINTEGDMLSSADAFQRELLGKPVSIITVVGILIIFMNYPKRTLHDYWLGSVVVNK